MKNLTTVSGDPLPATQTLPFTLQLGTVSVVDPMTPPAPANLHATVTTNNTQIALAWSPVLEPTSGIAFYQIYRDGTPYATSTTTSYTDSSGISSQTRHSYQVAAVNFDGVLGTESAIVTAVPVGIAAPATPTSTSVQIQFTEPVDPTTATNAANYSISGVTISTAALKPDGYTVTLTTTAALGSASHTLTIKNVKTQALSALPTLTTSFTYPTGGTYVAPPFTVGVNAESTNNPSPALSGTVSDPNASVTVRVNGSYYAATNNGDGTWSLPQGDISALGTGTYDVVTTGVNTSGVVAFDPTVNELSVNTTSPTVTMTAPTLPPVNSIPILFSEPVENFTLQDLQLTYASGGPAASEPLEGATLTTTNNQNWTLGNLSGLVGAPFTYALTLTGQGSMVTDLSGNPLANNASISWSSGPLVQSINTIGPNVTKATSVQYAVTFNESVSNVQAADFTLVTNGTAAGTIASLSGSGSAYTVTVNNVSGNGTLGLNLVDNDSITDQFGNPLGGTGAGNGNFTGQLYTIDNTAPTITISAPSSSLRERCTDHVHGDLCRRELQFQHPVRGEHQPDPDRNCQRHDRRQRFGSDPHGHDQRHGGRRYAGDCDRRRDCLGPGRQPGPGRRAQRDLHGGLPRSGHAGQRLAQPGHRHDDRSFRAGGG